MRKPKVLCLLVAVVLLFCCTGCTPLANSAATLSEVSSQLQQQEAPAQEDQSQDDVLLYEDDVRGVWISYIELQSMMQDHTQQDFAYYARVVLNTAKTQGINTVFVQVRSHGDAIYPSAYYPWGKYVTGTAGQAADYDPLAILIEQAHELGLSFHAWVNPYRLMSQSDFSTVNDSYLTKQWLGDTRYMRYKESDGYYYLDPNNEEVLELICNGVAELVQNYDVDGIHFDDYFYNLTPEEYGYDAATAHAATDRLVQQVYQTVKSINPAVQFGVSPGGNYYDAPASDTTQYTNIVTWCTQPGYLDYIAPQIYWEFDHEQAPFLDVFNKWINLTADTGVKLYVGLATYKFATTETLMIQQNLCVNHQGCGGFIHFRYENLCGSIR